MGGQSQRLPMAPMSQPFPQQDEDLLPVKAKKLGITVLSQIKAPVVAKAASKPAVAFAAIPTNTTKAPAKAPYKSLANA